MFGINGSYYNKAIKKLVISFGSLFNQIYCERYDSSDNLVEKIRVPISYGPKEKFIRKINFDSGITDNTHVQITLPLIGFDITSIIYDPTRKINKLKKVFKEENEILYTNWAETPYNINFGLYIFSRNIDDNLQILEQILPNFTPDFTLSLNMNRLHQKIDVPIVLNSVGMNEDYEGSFEIRRNITSVLDFTAKTYIYSQIKEKTPSDLIEDVDINLFDAFVDGDPRTTFPPSGFTGGTLIDDFGYTGDYPTNSVTWRI